MEDIMVTHRKVSKERTALKLSLIGTVFVATLGIIYGFMLDLMRFYLMVCFHY